jgi:LTXXQ motif family protein
MTHRVGFFARAAMTAGILSLLAAPPRMASASPSQFAQATPVPSTPAAPGHMTPGDHHAAHGPAPTRTQPVEIMISHMRTKLRITLVEQSQFDAVADVMRANAKTMETLLAERAQDTDRSAVASLRWYENLTEAHAAALKTFAPTFATLYATLSESQRKAADAMFLQLAERPFLPKSR